MLISIVIFFINTLFKYPTTTITGVYIGKTYLYTQRKVNYRGAIHSYPQLNHIE